MLGLLAGAIGQGVYDGTATFLERHVWTAHSVFGYLSLAAAVAIALVKNYRPWCAGAMIVFAGLWFWPGQADAFVEFFQEASRTIGWIALALALAIGMGLFIPNYRYSWAWIGGVAAGTAMGVLFYVLNLQLSDTAATWAGITVLGIVIGLLVGLIENFGADTVAEIEYENGEKVRVNLGDKMVTLPDATDGSKIISLSRDNITGSGAAAKGVAISEGKATHIGGMKITVIKRKKEGE